MDKRQIIIIGFLLLVYIYPVQALKLPDEYGINQCELIAKDYQREFGGDLIFVQPLKDNGAYDLGEYKGAWLNYAYNEMYGFYYIDFGAKTVYRNLEAVKTDFENRMKQKVVVYDVNQGGIPFALQYYY